MHPTTYRVAQRLKSAQLLPTPNTPNTILLAMSGGADSVALLRIFHELSQRPNWPLDLYVVHINHHLRPTADRDEAFVAELAQQLQLPFIRADVELTQQTNLEAEARHKRYAKLAELADQVISNKPTTNATTYIATGHHADDQLETLLMRALRGTSLPGLRGIHESTPLPTTTPPTTTPTPTPSLSPPGAKALVPPPPPTTHTPHPPHAPHTKHLIRPLLTLTRQEILDYLADLKQPYCHDETNDDTTFTRNHLRQNIIPALRELEPDLAQRATQWAEQATQLTHWLNQQTTQWITQHIEQTQTQTQTHPPTHRLRIPLAPFNTLPELVRFEVLKQCLHTFNLPTDRLTHRQLDPILQAADDVINCDQPSVKTFNLPQNVQAECLAKHLILYQRT